jgi:cytochrome c-type protein NapB
MSHARSDSCLQCHVVAIDPRAGTPVTPEVETAFEGAWAPGGARAWPGAPPTIPHATRMRERCDACHGPYGALGLRSTHPWRASCRQCHAASAELDQRSAVVVGGAQP